MVSVYQDGELCLCLPDCACCTACHKRIDDVDKCPEAESWGNPYRCDPNCVYYQEIWDEKELKEELEKDEDKILTDNTEANDGH